MIATTINTSYESKIIDNLSRCLEHTSFSFGKRYEGKVRDCYEVSDQLLLVTTDRLSAFDRMLAVIPFKGQVLNLISAWWFEQTEDIVPNHLITVPDANAILAKKCTVFPIEFVVRGYITGTTNTALWTQYQQGVRNYCGNPLPEGLRKNQKLERTLLTPTTKDKVHDRPISPTEIVQQGWMAQAEWDEVSEKALALYEFGVKVAREQGLILVDTKYEFGRDAKGQIVVIDELHTPDSSRYWLANSYEERFVQQLEPENIDKEFLRLWFAKHSDPYQDHVLPKAPQELIVTLSARYIQLFEMITGRSFVFPNEAIPIAERIKRNVIGYLA